MGAVGIMAAEQTVTDLDRIRSSFDTAYGLTDSLNLSVYARRELKDALADVWYQIDERWVDR